MVKAPGPKQPQKTSLRLPPELWRKVQHRAIDEGVSATALVVRAIEEMLKRDR